MKKLQSFLTENIPEKNHLKIIFWIKNTLILFFIYVCIRLYFIAINHIKNWTFSDWLVNYEDGGFKRRGLSGSLIFLIENITNIKIEYIVLSIEIFLYSYIYYKIIQLFYVKKIDLYFISMLLLPFGMAFNLIEVLCLGRKEIILIAIATFYVVNKDFKHKNLITIILLLIGILMHEMIFFYLFFFIAYDYLKNKRANFPFYLGLLLSAFLLMVSIFFLGGKINDGNSLEILGNKGIFFDENKNFFRYNESLKEINFIKIYYISYLLHTIEFLSCLIFMGYYVKINFPKNFKNYVYFLIFSLLFTTPLFYMAIDWFRWMYTYCILLILLISLMLDSNKTNMEIVLNQIKVKKYIIFIPVILFFLVLLHMQNDFIIESIRNKLNININTIDFSQ